MNKLVPIIVMLLLATSAYATGPSRLPVGQDQFQGQEQGQAQEQRTQSNSGIAVQSEFSASSAAMIYSVGCQIGASGQHLKGGVSFITDDMVCQALKMADAHRVSKQECIRDEEPQDVEDCQNLHEEKIVMFLAVAEDNIISTKDSNKMAKVGANVGTATVGFSLLFLLLLL